MNKPIPLEDAIKFWEMKEEIKDMISVMQFDLDNCICQPKNYDKITTRILLCKIESLGKKEKE